MATSGLVCLRFIIQNTFRLDGLKLISRSTILNFPQPVRASCRSSVNTCPASRKRFADTLASSWTRCIHQSSSSRDEKRIGCVRNNNLPFLLTSFSIPGLPTPLRNMWQFCKRSLSAILEVNL